MITVILVIHLLLAIALVATVLLQRSEGGGLGIGSSGGGGMGGFMSGRATANLLTRATAVLAAFFMATSLTLAILSVLALFHFFRFHHNSLLYKALTAVRGVVLGHA